MNVYDFDKTIYDGDSTFDFYIYCLKHYPVIYRKLPEVLWFGAGFRLGIVTKKEFKSRFFKFSTLLPNLEKSVSDFWDKNISKIKHFYLENQKPDDLIISASPMFILEEVCQRLNIQNLIATETDLKTGAISGENCYGEQKVERLVSCGFSKDEIDEFYSDSTSDYPLAKLAKKAFLVKGKKLMRWE